MRAAGIVAASRAFPLLWMAAEHARSFVYGGFPWNLTGWALAPPPGLDPDRVRVGRVRSRFRRRRGVGAPRGRGRPASSGVSARGRRRRAPRRRNRTRPARRARQRPRRKQDPCRARPAEPDERRAGPLPKAPPPATPRRSRRGFEAGGRRNRSRRVSRVGVSLYWERSARLRGDLTRLASTCRCAVLFNDVIVEPGGKALQRRAHRGLPAGLPKGSTARSISFPSASTCRSRRSSSSPARSPARSGSSPAPSPTVLRSGPLAVGVGICYEILYPSLARRQSADGANLLATISNDSWYGRAGAQEQHFAGAVLRSVENERYLVRAAITGISGIVDERGRIVAELRRNRAGTIFAVVLATGQDGVDAVGTRSSGRLTTTPRCAVLLFGLARWRRERAARMTAPRGAARRRNHDRTRRSDLLPDDRLGAPPGASGLSLISTPRGARSRI